MPFRDRARGITYYLIYPHMMKHAKLLKLILAGAFFAPVIISASSEDLPLDIAVRSEIDRPFEGWGKAAVKEHGKAYYLASVSQTKSTVDLVMPVDEAALTDLLRAQLSKRGFHEVTTTQPEIILTVLYGRGYLKNPYIDDTTFNEMTNRYAVGGQYEDTRKTAGLRLRRKSAKRQS